MATVVFYLGDVEKVAELLEYPVKVFDTEFQTEWLNDPLGKYIIKTIDKSDVIEGAVINSPVLGIIPPHYLSCGCKSVLLAAFHPDIENKVLDGSKMGDNYFPVLFEVVRQTNRRIVVQVGRLLREEWGEEDTVLFLPKKVTKTGFKACFDYLALNTHMFYKGEGYGTQG